MKDILPYAILFRMTLKKVFARLNRDLHLATQKF